MLNGSTELLKVASFNFCRIAETSGGFKWLIADRVGAKGFRASRSVSNLSAISLLLASNWVVLGTIVGGHGYEL